MRAPVPAISVVMAVFNGERFVEQAVRSILSQSFADFEFIIVDNRSTDKTCDIIESFRDPRIKLLRNDINLGQTSALNVGIRNSRAPLIARMDADDVAIEHRFARQVSYLENHPEIAALGSWAFFIDERGRYLRTFEAPCDPQIVALFMAGSPELSYGCTLHPTLMVRRTAFDAAGLYDEEHGARPGYPQDYELWSRMIRKGFRFANLGEPLLRYRVLPTSESRSNEERLLRYRLEITVRKLSHYCPELTERETLTLARMLEYRTQLSREDARRVFVLFDRYFDTYVRHTGISEHVDEVRSKMKLYYVPVLFLTDKVLSARTYVGILRKHARLLRDAKFYRKIAKVAFRRLPRQLEKEGFEPSAW
jgi:glycosyltransferase involved in cell wall biosynthesis